jgi:TolB-like protein
MVKKKIGIILFSLCLLGGSLINVFADKGGISILILDIKNQSNNTQYDYLQYLIKAILLFDFATVQELAVIDTPTLEKAVQEKTLLLSNLKPEEALDLALSLNADYLLSGKYVMVKEEVEISISLLEVKTKQPVQIIEQGKNENLIHAIAEQIVFRLSGKMPEFQSELYERSIVSLIDEKPGSISLHTTLKEAEVYLNNQLVGYTTGMMLTPFKIENLKPGQYTLRVHLPEFGVIKTPEVTFHDWEQEIEITPGKNYVVKANIQHFSYLLTNLMELLAEKMELSLKTEIESKNALHEITFQDRQGKEIKVLLDFTASIEKDKTSAKAKLTYNKIGHELEAVCALGQTKNTSTDVELVKLTVSIDYKYKGKAEITYKLERKDLSPTMWKE